MHELISHEAKANVLAIHPDVMSVGEGTGDSGPEVVVMIERTSDMDESAIPNTIEGYHVRVERSPRITPHGHHRSKVRPIAPGASVSNVDTDKGGNGTMGWLLTDGSDVYVSSNHHVLAAGGAEAGDRIIVPGVSDGGLDDVEGSHVADYADETYFSETEADLAWGTLRDGVGADPVPLHLPEPAGKSDPEVGDTIHKTGRTTGTVTATVEQVNVSVSFPDSDVIATNQAVSTAYGDPGDSGSPLMAERDGTYYATGMHWGGSGEKDLFMPISAVEDASGMSVILTGGELEDPTPPEQPAQRGGLALLGLGLLGAAAARKLRR